MAIDVIGDRRNTGFCMMCGTTLMIPWNDYQCCPECTRKITHIRKVTEARKEKIRKVGKNIIKSNAIMRQRKPIGGIPQ